MTRHTIKVTIRGARPAVWRRIAVPSDLTLADLHRVLQIAMGWTDSHLHRFEHRGVAFGPRDLEEDLDLGDESRVRLSDLLRRPKDRLLYQYDFGDGWEHDVVLESIDSSDSTDSIDRPAGRRGAPRLLAGKGACPPEDVGGVGGYAEFLRALRHPSHRDHALMTDWIGGAFDPAAFDPAAVNRALGRLRLRGRAPARRPRGGGARRPRRLARRRAVREDEIDDAARKPAIEAVFDSVMAKLAGARPGPFSDEELAAFAAAAVRVLASQPPGGHVVAVEVAELIQFEVRRCELGSACRRARVGMRLTRRAVAARLGVQESSVWAIELSFGLEFDPSIARQYVRLLGLDAWLREWCRANAGLARRMGLSDA